MTNRTLSITAIINDIRDNDLRELSLISDRSEDFDDEIQYDSLEKAHLVANGRDRNEDEFGAKTGNSTFALKTLSYQALVTIINKLQNLKSLTIDYLAVRYLPPEIGQLTKLETLALRNNYIETLPVELGKLVNLRILDLSDNRLTEIPGILGNLSSLEILKVGKTSSISQERARVLRKEICKLNRLQILEAQGHKFLDLPREIGQLLSLEYLNVSSNRLIALPEELAELKNLQTLDVSFNDLSSFPKEMDKNSSLKYLNIRSNKFSVVPTEVTQLKALIELNISNNQIVTIPSSIGSLTNLRVLNAWYCKLSSLSREISQLKNLEVLDLSYNRLTNLPKEIDKLHDLKKLDLQGNQLTIPEEIIVNVNNPKSILNYYISLQRETRRQLNELKLLIVGQGSVGKTSLIQRIIHDTFNQNQSKTEGISIKQWTIDDGEQTVSSMVNILSSIKLNIWDFGGQEIMHATHQFFLTKRSLYLLVLDARLTQEENRVEYWLKIIQSFGGESPVLIVGNKTDQHPLDIDRTGLQKKYPNIVGILGTSAATSAGIEELKAEIAKQVDTLPHVRDLLPETWFMVKSKLEGLAKNKNFFTQDEYLRLCDTSNVTDETSQHTLIGFLHAWVLSCIFKMTHA